MISIVRNIVKSRIGDVGHGNNAMADDATRFSDRETHHTKWAARNNGIEFQMLRSDAVCALKDATSTVIDDANETFAVIGDRIADNLRASAHQLG